MIKKKRIRIGVSILLCIAIYLIYNYYEYIFAVGFIVAAYFQLKPTEDTRSETITLSEIDHMTGSEFEYYLAELYSEKGYKAFVTQKGGDQGADVILTKRWEKTVVQAKRYNCKVGNRAVQEVVASIRYYNATNAMVITNNYFTKPAIELAKANSVELIDRDGLKKLI